MAHCGGSLRGSHGWSVVLTDIFSGWTEARLSWNRNHLNVRGRIEEIEQRKNDNAHVEQKNRALIREHLGHERIGEMAAVTAFNEALRLISLRANLYQASSKLLGKKRDDPNRKPTKIYEKKARTPWQRLMESGKLSAAERTRLEELKAQNDPLTLNGQIEAKLKEAWELNAGGGTRAA